MEWSNELVLDFLEAYENEPVIWNPAHALHKNRSEVYDAWKRVQENVLDGSISIAELKKKKDSLMASYRTCINKVKSTRNAEERYKPTWFAFDKMASFLNERDQPRGILNTEDISFVDFYESNDDDDKKKICVQNVHEVDTNDILDITEFGSGSTTSNKREAILSPLPQKRRKHNSELRPTNSEAIDVTKTTNKKELKENDELEIYGALLVAKLRKFDEETRDRAMNKIDNFLYELKLNNFHYP